MTLMLEVPMIVSSAVKQCALSCQKNAHLNTVHAFAVKSCANQRIILTVLSLSMLQPVKYVTSVYCSIHPDQITDTTLHFGNGTTELCAHLTALAMPKQAASSIDLCQLSLRPGDP